MRSDGEQGAQRAISCTVIMFFDKLGIYRFHNEQHVKKETGPLHSLPLGT